MTMKQLFINNRTKYLLNIYINQGDERSHFPYELAQIMNCNKDMLNICEQYDYLYTYNRILLENIDNEFIDYTETDFIDYNDLIDPECLCEEDDYDDEVNDYEDDQISDNDSKWITVDNKKMKSNLIISTIIC